MVKVYRAIHSPRMLFGLIGLGIMIAVVAGLSGRAGASGPVCDPATRHCYESVSISGGITWEAAKAAAEAQVLNGIPGHLATLTSAAENQFIVDNFPGAFAGPDVEDFYWIGAEKLNPSLLPADGWVWVTGEPFIKADANWGDGEPSAIPNIDEDAIQLWHTPLGSWNNQERGVLINGYVVEYEALTCGPSKIDVWDTSDPNNVLLIGQITTIGTAQTGEQHYSFSNASGHPTGVNLDGQHANLWVHEDTNTSDLTFGFIFGKDNSGASFEDSLLNFRIVGSDTDPFVSQSDDLNEASETPTGSNAFVGDFSYGNNTDGIAVSGISGAGWTIIVDSVDFGPIITEWFAANGSESGFDDDLVLTLGNEYRLTPACSPPADVPVTIEDEDEDGIIDEDDLCLGTADGEPVDANGCSDAQVDGDSDGVCDPGAPSVGPSGCDPDGDGDGVGDSSDVCPGFDDNVDTDSDGTPDGCDPFPSSNTEATVVINGCDTGIVNEFVTNGANFNDLIGAAAFPGSRNHGDFVRQVSQMANQWKKDGLISGKEKGKITSCAARSKSI